MKTNMWLLLLPLSAINFFLPEEVFYVLMIALLIIGTLNDKAVYYNSSFLMMLPLILLVVFGMVRGMGDINKDYIRDVVIFSKNIVYILGGIALGKYIKDFNTFFKYFFILAFIGSLYHIGTFAAHIHEATSLESIRFYAGYENVVEAVTLAIFVSRKVNKDFRKIVEELPRHSTIMIMVIGLSFLLYFSRTMIVVLFVLSFFLCNIVYIRKIFSKQNAKVFRALIFAVVGFYLIVLIASLGPSDSPLQRLVVKFQDIPQEVSWDAKRNASATLDDINDNWRGYEAYQGLLKYYSGTDLQKTLGYGFNAKIDLNIIMKLAGQDYDKVPVLHNEYVTLLVKTGWVGLILYLAFLYMFGMSKINYTREEHPEIYYSYQMLSGMSIVSLLNTYIGFGLLGIGAAALPLIIGFFWGNIERHKRAVIEMPAFDFVGTV